MPYEKTLPDFFEEFFGVPFGPRHVPSLPKDRVGLRRFSDAFREHRGLFEFPDREDDSELRPGIFTLRFHFSPKYIIGHSRTFLHADEIVNNVKKALLFSDRIVIDTDALVMGIAGALMNKERPVSSELTFWNVDGEFLALAQLSELLRLLGNYRIWIRQISLVRTLLQ